MNFCGLYGEWTDVLGPCKLSFDVFQKVMKRFNNNIEYIMKVEKAALAFDDIREQKFNKSRMSCRIWNLKYLRNI